MEQRISYITLGVRNLNISETFYSDILGWQKMAKSTENIIFYNLDGIILSLYPIKALADDSHADFYSKGFCGFTLSYNTRAKDEVDGLMWSLEKKGAVIVREPTDTFWGGYHGYVRDPNGYRIEIVWNPFIKLNESGKVIIPSPMPEEGS